MTGGSLPALERDMGEKGEKQNRLGVKMVGDNASAERSEGNLFNRNESRRGITTKSANHSGKAEEFTQRATEVPLK